MKYLGFGFYYDLKSNTYKSRPHEDSIEKFKRKLKQLTSRSYSIDFKTRIKKLNEVTRGWVNYFSSSSMKKKMIKSLRTLKKKNKFNYIAKKWSSSDSYLTTFYIFYVEYEFEKSSNFEEDIQ